jgi:hypothetical protein
VSRRHAFEVTRCGKATCRAPVYFRRMLTWLSYLVYLCFFWWGLFCEHHLQCVPCPERLPLGLAEAATTTTSSNGGAAWIFLYSKGRAVRLSNIVRSQNKLLAELYKAHIGLNITADHDPTVPHALGNFVSLAVLFCSFCFAKSADTYLLACTHDCLPACCQLPQLSRLVSSVPFPYLWRFSLHTHSPLHLLH